MKKLCFVSCTKEKIWDIAPDIGAVEAACAYRHPTFILACRIAQKLSARVVIFSAKYGFMDPSEKIPHTYDVTFYRQHDPVIDHEALYHQARAKQLLSYQEIYAFCTEQYHQRLLSVYEGLGTKIFNPLLEVTNDVESCLQLNALNNKIK